MIAEKSIDSLKIFDRLKHSRMAESAAREIANIFSDILDSQLATKRDLNELELRLKAEIEKSKNDTLKWVAGTMLAQTGILISAIKFLK